MKKEKKLELIEYTRLYLIEKYGIWFLNLSEKQQNDMIFATLMKALEQQKSRN